MNDGSVWHVLNEALAEAVSRGETPTKLTVGYRIWETIAPFVDQDKWNASTSHSRFKGMSLVVREDFKPDHLEVTTREEESLLASLDQEMGFAMRDTGLAPLSFEISEDLYNRFCRKIKSSTYRGIPVRIRSGLDQFVAYEPNYTPPEWCVPGVCLARLDDDRTWAKVLEVQTSLIVVDELGLERPGKLQLRELRTEWTPIPARVRMMDRFNRLLFSDPVSDQGE